MLQLLCEYCCIHCLALKWRIAIVKVIMPDGRTCEQVENHYRVEKSIADKLKRSSLEERKVIYSQMYTDLFSKVPDHPRLIRRASALLSEESIRSKALLVDGHISKSTVFVEFAPGDCLFAEEMAKRTKYVYGVDISDQRLDKNDKAKNFSLVVYDGYALETIQSATVDVVFSDQLIEHFHPEDTALHFKLVHKILKKGGMYIFRTPHALSGPHDVSKYFSDTAEGFHLKEWTYLEIKKMVVDIGFTKFKTYLIVKGHIFRIPYLWFAFCEIMLNKYFSKKGREKIVNFLFLSLCAIAKK